MANLLTGKFGRNYVLSVQTQSGDTLTIKPPLTIEFDITRKHLSSANVCQIRVFNLSQKNRDQIRKDITDYGNFKRVTLQAGYGLNIPVVFSGNVTVAWSVREGTNFITQIESFDGGFAYDNALSTKSITKNTVQKSVIESLIDDLKPYGVSKGVVGSSFENTITRGNSYVGSTTELLTTLTASQFFIDNTVAYALARNEVTNGAIPLINSKSGLLGTPTREQNYVDFDMLFEPKFMIGQQIKLESVSENKNAPNFDGFYKVISIKHRGMISAAVCGNATTSVRLLPAKPAFQRVGPS